MKSSSDIHEQNCVCQVSTFIKHHNSQFEKKKKIPLKKSKKKKFKEKVCKYIFQSLDKFI